MNWIDGLIIIAFIIYIFEGLRRGFIEQTLELLGFFLSIVLAAWTYSPLASWLVARVGLNEQLSGPVSFLVIWVIYQAIYSLILHLLYPRIPAHWRLNRPNHFAGIVPAVLKCLTIVTIIITMVAILPVPTQLKNEVNNSWLGSRFVSQASRVEGLLGKAFGQDFKDGLTFITVPAQTEEIIRPDEKVDLKFTTIEVTTDRASEQKMLDLLNAERAKVGLGILVWDERLAEVARTHSRDMFARGYFAHEDPDGNSPFDRMNTAGITYEAAGENLAYAANVSLAHNGLMRSPGHRANILEAEFGKVGIGVIDGGIYGKMFTQNFTN